MAVNRPSTTRPTNLSFTELGVPAPIVAALAAAGIDAPFPIQAATLPHSLAGRDVLGRGRTGSGKTLAFAIPLLTRLAASGTPRRAGRPRALVLAPTRELAAQIEAAMAPLAAILSLRTTTVFGGVGPQPQIKALRAGVDVVVACPGRLADHIASGHASLDAVEVTVLDEADHMADLGFLPVVRRLLDLTPRRGQRMLFSATLDAGVDVLVRRYLEDPVTLSVDADRTPVDTMAHHVLHVRHEDRLAVLVDLVAAPGRTIVFARTKRRTKVLTRQLVEHGVAAAELHGNLAQNARTKNLQAFADGRLRTLVATDIAARGIHVDDVALVIHADPPAEHKAYLHRSGRTARAGAHGKVITLMTDDQVGEVRELARKAGVQPTTTRSRPGDALLAELAPGKRTFVVPRQPAAPSAEAVDNPPRRTGTSRRATGGGATPRHAGYGASPQRAGNGASPRRAVDGATPRRDAGAGATPPSGGAAAFSARSRGGRAR